MAKICPLLTAGYYGYSRGGKDDTIECFENKCAWWDNRRKRCNPRTTTLGLGGKGEDD